MMTASPVRSRTPPPADRARLRVGFAGLTGHAHCVGVDEPPEASDDLDLACLEKMLHPAALLLYYRGLARQQRAKVDSRRAEHDAEAGGVARPAQPLGRGHQGLGRDAAPIEAGAADRARLDECDARAKLRGPQGRDVPGRPAAQDHDPSRHLSVSSLVISVNLG